MKKKDELYGMCSRCGYSIISKKHMPCTVYDLKEQKCVKCDNLMTTTIGCPICGGNQYYEK